MIFCRGHDAVGRTEEVCPDELVGLLGVLDVGACKVLQTAEVVERMVAHLMTLFHYTAEEVGVFPYIVANHEKRCVRVVRTQRFQDERSGFGYRSIIKGEIDCALLLVHAPQRTGEKPPNPKRGLLQYH